MKDKIYIKKLLYNLKQYRFNIILIIICLLASTLLNLVLPLFNKRMIDYGFMKNDLKVILTFCSLILLFSLLMFTLDFIRERIRINISAKTKFKLHKDALDHLLKINVDYFNKKNCNEIFNNINTDINNMLLIVNSATFFIISQFFSVVGGLIGLFIISKELTLMVIIFIPIKLIILKYLSNKRYKLTKDYINYNSNYSHWFDDNLHAFKEIRLFGLQPYKLHEFEEKQKTILDTDVKINLLDIIRNFFDKSIAQLLIFLIYIIGAILMLDLKLSFGSIFAFINYSVYVIAPISSILGIGYILSGIMPSTKRYYALFEEKAEYDIDNTSTKKTNVCREIKFKNISFSYDKKPVLTNINFTIGRHEKVALVGLNGSGKTTILNLLQRFYEPDSGEILLDGININSLNLHKYRDLFSMVSQETYLFDTTIEKNIKLYSKPEDLHYRQVVKDSQLSDKSITLCDEYFVGRNGTKLSGGQRQKISLARALIRNRPILILDEATSQVDNYSEDRINALLKTKLKDNMVLLVTHRTDILKNMDKIIVIDEGRICAIDNHNTLRETSHIYNDIISSRRYS